MASKQTTVRARKKSGPKKVKHVEYRRPDKGEGATSTTHYHQPEGPMSDYIPPFEETHTSNDAALDHFKNFMGMGDSDGGGSGGSGNSGSSGGSGASGGGNAGGGASDDEAEEE